MSSRNIRRSSSNRNSYYSKRNSTSTSSITSSTSPKNNNNNDSQHKRSSLLTKQNSSSNQYSPSFANRNSVCSSNGTSGVGGGGGRKGGGSIVFEKYDVLERLGSGEGGSMFKVKLKGGNGLLGGKSISHKKGRKSLLLSKGLRRTHSLPSDITATTTTHHNKKKESSVSSGVFVIKTVSLEDMLPMTLQQLREEINTLKQLEIHPNLVRFYEHHHHKSYMYMVNEYCEGGDLFTYGPYSERESARITGELLSAVKYLHSHGIIHGDVTFKNILFEQKYRESSVKLVNFSSPSKFQGGQRDVMNEQSGAIYHLSPQALQGIVRPEGDLWSIGVVIFMLLSSTMPFYDERPAKLISMIMRADYSFEEKYWVDITKEAQRFVASLLQLDPRKRRDAQTAMSHSWLRCPVGDKIVKKEDLIQVGQSLLEFQKVSKLKKLALNLIAQTASGNEILKLKKVFDYFDTEKDGSLTLQELTEALKDYKWSKETVLQIFESLDAQKHGHITYSDFLAATLESNGYVITEEQIMHAFNTIDTEACGYLSRSNLRRFLNLESDYAAEINQIFSETVMTKEGKISYDDFCSVVHPKSVPSRPRRSSILNPKRRASVIRVK